jgi:RNA polymerase sigma-70 factor, ECF subfamily
MGGREVRGAAAGARSSGRDSAPSGGPPIRSGVQQLYLPVSAGNGGYVSQAGTFCEEISRRSVEHVNGTGMVIEGSDRELVAACQRGEREAFRALFETYKDRVFSIAFRFSGEEATAMDIAQDTFVKLFSCIRDFRGESRFETWIYRLVVNGCMDHRRRTWRMLPMADRVLGSLRDSRDCLSDLLRSEMGARVHSAVERLSPGLRIVVVLRYTEGLAYDEIAEVLGCSPGTVASRLNRAHKLLERRLSHLVKEKGGVRHV